MGSARNVAGADGGQDAGRAEQERYETDAELSRERRSIIGHLYSPRWVFPPNHSDDANPYCRGRANWLSEGEIRQFWKNHRTNCQGMANFPICWRNGLVISRPRVMLGKSRHRSPAVSPGSIGARWSPAFAGLRHRGDGRRQPQPTLPRRCSPLTQRTVPELARITTLSVVIMPARRLTPSNSEPSVTPVAAKMASPLTRSSSR